jgi:hypothetical protein
VLKKRVLDTYLQQSGTSWEALTRNSPLIDGLFARDLRYHDLSNEGWFNHLVYPDTLFTETEIHTAWSVPPPYTRAHIRGKVLTQARQHKFHATIERWQDVVVDGDKLRLPDPLAFDHALFGDDFEQEWWSQSIDHEDAAIRIRTIKHLIWKKHSEALALLIRKAQYDEYDDVRSAAIEALGYRGDNAAKDILIKLLNDPAMLVRWAAIEALDKVTRGISTPPPLITPSNDEDGESLIQIIS